MLNIILQLHCKIISFILKLLLIRSSWSCSMFFLSLRLSLLFIIFFNFLSIRKIWSSSWMWVRCFGVSYRLLTKWLSNFHFHFTLTFLRLVVRFDWPCKIWILLKWLSFNFNMWIWLLNNPRIIWELFANSINYNWNFYTFYPNLNDKMHTHLNFSNISIMYKALFYRLMDDIHILSNHGNIYNPICQDNPLRYNLKFNSFYPNMGIPLVLIWDYLS